MVTQFERDIREALLDRDTELMILKDWVRLEAEMRRAGQTRAEWYGEGELPKINQIIAVWPGCCLATVVDYGIKRGKGIFERCVWVQFDNGEFMKYLSSECKSITPEERKEIEERNAEFKKRLIGAGKKVERQRKERRAKVVKGSHLLDEMLTRAEGLDVERKSSFHMIKGSAQKRAVYVAIKGGRVDLSGFCIDHPAITVLTAEEARKRHLGRVRGQFDFSVGDEPVMEAFDLALKELKEKTNDDDASK